MDVMVAGVVAAGVAVVAVWPLVRHAVTAVHEAGHAVVALLLGGRLSAIRVRTDSSGETVWFSSRSRVRRAVCATAGYPAPVVFAALMLASVSAGWERYALGVAAGVVCVSVLWWRGLWTVVVMSVCAATLVAGAWFGGLLALGTAGVVSGVGVFGGLRAAGEALMASTSRDDGSDVATVATSLFVPVLVSKLGLSVVMVVLWGVCSVLLWQHLTR